MPDTLPFRNAELEKQFTIGRELGRGGMATVYLAEERKPGGSLRDRLTRDGRLPVAEATRIAHEVGTALDYAHRTGFVHRDVKPENILFADGQAVLADFGVARTCGISMADTVTEAGTAVGTPAYMSPEQASGDSDIGTASDVYSLACVVYEMLAGTPPLSAAKALAKVPTDRFPSVSDFT